MATFTAIPPKSQDVAELLDELGLTIGAQQVEIIDFKQAETGYVHHTQIPVAIVGYALVSPVFARGRFPDFSFLDLIRKRPSMDEREACALAALCGADATPPFWGNPGPFGRHLWSMIEKYELDEFFVRLDPAKAYGTGEHYLMRPRGCDWPDYEQNEAELKKWRASYKKLPGVRQLMVATIIRLYNSDEKLWLVRVPKKWHAAEGIDILRASGALADWCKPHGLVRTELRHTI